MVTAKDDPQLRGEGRSVSCTNSHSHQPTSIPAMPGSSEASHQTHVESLLTPSLESQNLSYRQSGFGRSRSKSPSAAPPNFDVSGDKSKNELQKVLALIIARLRERSRPPSLIDQLSLDWSKPQLTRVDAVVESLRAAVRTNSDNKEMHNSASEDHEESELLGFSTSATMDMMVQLREILIMARKQHWNIMPSQWVVLYPRWHPTFSFCVSIQLSSAALPHSPYTVRVLISIQAAP